MFAFRSEFPQCSTSSSPDRAGAEPTPVPGCGLSLHRARSRSALPKVLSKDRSSEVSVAHVPVVVDLGLHMLQVPLVDERVGGLCCTAGSLRTHGHVEKNCTLETPTVPSRANGSMLTLRFPVATCAWPRAWLSEGRVHTQSPWLGHAWSKFRASPKQKHRLHHVEHQGSRTLLAIVSWCSLATAVALRTSVPR